MQINSLQLAVNAIHNKECVVFPTETVYGLGANALCSQSVDRIFTLKKRPSSNPLIVHVAHIDQILSVAKSLSPLEEKLLELFSPGPLSLILPKKDNIPNNVTGNLDTVGVRIPNHKIALAFLQAVSVPICAPSANISGQPSPTTFEMAKHYMNGKAIILDGGTVDIGIESTVIKVDGNQIFLLRPGVITKEMIAEKTGVVPIINNEHNHLSPGTRFPHYKPKAKIYVFEQNLPNIITENSALLYLNAPINSQLFHKSFFFQTIEEYIHALYYTFFECDQLKIDTIYCELPLDTHQGKALRDRLIKAAL